MSKKAIYPGTFDPITNGHLDIIKRAKRLFDEVVVAVAISSSKKPMFSLKERLEFVEESIKEIDGVKVITFESLLIDLLKKENSFIVVRGLRAVSDFEYELQMDYANSSLYPQMETVYLSADINNSFVSSSVVRTILNFNGEFKHLVPEPIFKKIKDIRCI